MNEDSVSTTLQPAYILHYTLWRESSFIVDAFTLSHGRISLMAKSARASKARTRALYQPFRPLLLSWVGGSELRTLTGIEESGAPLSLADTELACGYYFNELVLRLLGKDQPQPAVFAHYAVALANLATVDTVQPGDLQAVLRTFELQLLDGLSVLPDLARCTADGSAIDANRMYRYHPANAIAVASNRLAEGQLSLGIQKQKTRMGDADHRDPSVQADGVTPDEGVMVSGRTLLALSSLTLDDAQVLEEARILMRRILRVHLGDRPLKSRELFDTLVRRD
ncbi:MAG: DNA repair protein RecO [Granulosicoccus sp.]|nr:DNA repair protein RecO [Granulosicoccus sp.]